jgi:prepilin-type N-terminal cleavage/methylation domain-containing protein
MKKNGFTIIEVMIVIAITGIVATIALSAIYGVKNSQDVSMGVNGMVESRCIDGYKFIIAQNGEARQVLSEFGKGVPCNTAIEGAAKPSGR